MYCLNAVSPWQCVWFKLLGFLENSWNFIFSHSCTNPATSFHAGAELRMQDFGNGGPISVNSSYLLGDLPPNSKFPLQKNTQNTQENASNLPPPRYVVSSEH